MPSAYAETKKDKEKGVREDIGGLMAELSKRPTAPERIRKLTGSGARGGAHALAR